ncbi:MAG: (2Fe-2S)-binding protein [Deltaproteobacteria bacterium]|nr:(2Fe-2S)-binding protein [Deltaproteobacteria bacterium]
MLVCHCLAIRDREVRSAIAQGAETSSEVARSCGAGNRCGGCVPLIEEMLAEHTARHAARANGSAGQPAANA